MEESTNFTTNSTILGHCGPLHHEYQPNPLTLVLFGYVMPVLLLVTATFNAMVIAVLSRENMRTGSNIILLAISISDTLTMLFPAPFFIYMYTLGNYVYHLNPPFMCYLWDITTLTLPTMFHTFSIWLTLALATQRYIQICHTPLAQIYCTNFRVGTVVVILFILSAFYQLPLFFYVSHQTHSEIEGCLSCKADWAMSNDGTFIYLYFATRPFIVNLIPCAILVVLNILLFRTIRRAEMTRNRLMKSIKKKESRRSREKSNTTMMLIVIVTIFLLTEMPLGIVNPMRVFELLNESNQIIFNTITNFMILSTYPLNFGIYCGMSQQFRETFKVIILRQRPTRNAQEDQTTLTTFNSRRGSQSVL